MYVIDNGFHHACVIPVGATFSAMMICQRSALTPPTVASVEIDESISSIAGNIQINSRRRVNIASLCLSISGYRVLN